MALNQSDTQKGPCHDRVSGMDATDSLAVLAGGDEHELAVEQIRADVAARSAKLRAEHPLFADGASLFDLVDLGWSP
jgi:hypothetical protein